MSCREKMKKILTIAICILMTAGLYGKTSATCFAAEEKKADISALSGFGKNYTENKETGEFEIEGVMLYYGSIYNITVDGDNIQAWCGDLRSNTWGGKRLERLLDDPNTLFYGSVKGKKDSAEFNDPVEFTRPNGKTY